MTQKPLLARLAAQRQRLRGGLVATVGFILSPLSWWNDLLVNVPLAVAFAWVVALVDSRLFVPGVVVGYWLTNVLGFVMLHVGAEGALTGSTPAYTRRRLARDLLLSVGYTLLVVLLLSLGIVSLPAGIFG
ncbi:hypothetical protein SAMN04487949_2246 [Halogranum gelatinilyticum]|uniref:Uncharacterized protein n=1 Tax=Halogranum gelatinilyticum TaxID=660521 RepID=A0A1G9UM70_9EURY|nr:hypothetical protein [Halogranum gelatinilyticum]SDM60957.1 hypothetical protein SAMN04487949_2246 [Halogranum gelatinilyticum]